MYYTIMGVVDDVMEYLRSIPGVKSVFPMDDDLVKEIDSIERCIRTGTGHDYKNIGFDDVKGKRFKICVLHTHDYFFYKRALVKLRTTDGTILGTSVNPHEMPAFKRMDNVIWLSDDFVVFTDRVGHGTEEFVTTSFDIPEISMEVPGCKGVIGASPTMSSDMLLKSKVGIPSTNEIYSTVVGFDISNGRQSLSLCGSLPLLPQGYTPYSRA